MIYKILLCQEKMSLVYFAPLLLVMTSHALELGQQSVLD